MNLSPLPIQQFLGNNGRPLDGGLLYTYAAGTSTKVATYSDESGTLNTNPIVLDFRGEARVWLDPEVSYKFALSPRGDTDPPTKAIWTVDNIAAGITFFELTQQLIGRILWPRTQEEIDAGVTPIFYYYPPGNVKRYGALGEDGDDTIALAQAALAYRTLFFPGPAIYGTTAEIFYESVSGLDAVHITFEAGAKLRTIGATNRAFHLDGQPANTTSMALVMTNPTIIGSNSGGTGAANEAIFLDGIALFWIENPVITGDTFDKGIYCYGAQQGEIHGGYIAQMDTAIHLQGEPDPPASFGYAGANGIEIHGMSLSCVGTQVKITSVDSGFVHHNHMISAPLGIDVDIQFGLSAIRLSNNHIEGVPAGSFTAGIRIDGSPGDVVGIRIDGNMIAGEGTLLHLAEGAGITVEANSFFGGSVDGDITYDVGTSFVRTINNYHNGQGTFTDGSTFSMKLNNVSAGALDFGNDTLSLRLDTTDVRTLELGTGSLPAGGAGQDGRTILDNGGDFVFYTGGLRYKVTGTPF